MESLTVIYDLVGSHFETRLRLFRSGNSIDCRHDDRFINMRTTELNPTLNYCCDDEFFELHVSSGTLLAVVLKIVFLRLDFVLAFCKQ